MNLKLLAFLLDVLLTWMTNRWLTVKNPDHLDLMSRVCDNLSEAHAGVCGLLKAGAKVTDADEIQGSETHWTDFFYEFVHNAVGQFRKNP